MRNPQRHVSTLLLVTLHDRDERSEEVAVDLKLVRCKTERVVAKEREKNDLHNDWLANIVQSS